MRIIIVSQRVLGHIYPVLGLAEELRSRGHEITVLSHESNKFLIEKAGVSFVEMGWGKFADKNIDHALRDIRQILMARGPDLVIVDSGMPAPAYASELLAIPWVSYQTTLPSTCNPQTSQDTVSLRMQRQYETELNRLRDQLGLPPLDNAIRARGDLAGLSPYLHLVMVYPELVPESGSLPANTKVVGPCGPVADTVPAPRVSSSPHIIVCASSLPRIEFRELMNRYVQASIRTMGGGCYRVVIIENHDYEAHNPLPSNVVWTTEMPSHHLYMPSADLVVTHGGCGTLQKAIKYGVPMIIIPLGEDHYSLASRCVNLGIATMLLPEEMTEQALLNQVNEMLRNRSYLEKAKDLSRRNERIACNRLAADYLEIMERSIQEGKS